MSATDPSVARGMVLHGAPTSRCQCTHLNTVHQLGKACSAAWVDGRVWIRCGCRTFQEAKP